jgi:intracellular sulfur oxidation DsrE/DsrF family protein
MKILVLPVVLGLAAGLSVAEPVTGPIIDDFGPVYYVPEKPMELPPGVNLKAVFDVAGTPEGSETPNYRLEAVARYLNMHARAGVPSDRVETAVVLHGRAARSALRADIFEERYGHAHPDAVLIRELAAAGVRIIVCGQSATAFGFRSEELAAGVEMSLSAMTALVRLQQNGFALIPWGMN